MSGEPNLERIVDQIIGLPAMEQEQRIVDLADGDRSLETRIRTRLAERAAGSGSGAEGVDATIDFAPDAGEDGPEETIDLESGPSDSGWVEVDTQDDAEDDEQTRSTDTPPESTSPASSPFKSMPDRIGDFSVDKLLGAGGMGSVFLCKQDSNDRPVAVKLMNPKMVGRRAMQRFEFEIESLAKLVHPAVARLYEAGVRETSDGPAPYLAMEFIQGARTIVEYAKELGLDLRARLQLFASACDGVAYGHGRGVIHRDLKPPNLLVDQEGRPKVIDFGVALRDDDNDGRHEIVGTLQYMSPEQASGGDVGTGADVYALGIILYELVTDRLPYEVRGTSLRLALESIANVEVPSLADQAADVNADLEAVVAKALARDPKDRYQGAAELGEEIRRYLNDEPLVARPPTTWETIKRIGRKNRIQVGLAVATLVAIVLGLVGTTFFGLRAEAAREMAVAAEAETAKALRQVLDERDRLLRSLKLFTGVIGGVEPQILGERIAGEIETRLDRNLGNLNASDDDVAESIYAFRGLAEVFVPTDIAIMVIDEFLVGPTTDLLNLIQDDPLAYASLQEFLGLLMVRTGAFDEGIRSLEEAASQWEARLGPTRVEARRTRNAIANALINAGRGGDFVDGFEVVVESGRDSNGRLDREGLFSAMVLATALGDLGRLEESRSLFIEAMEGFTELADAGDGEAGEYVSRIGLNLGAIDLGLGDIEAAEKSLLLARERVLETDEADRDELLGAIEFNLAQVAYGKADLEAAVARAEAAQFHRLRYYGADHPKSIEAVDALGRYLYHAGRYAEAAAQLQRTWESYLPNEPRNSLAQQTTGVMLAESLVSIDDVDGAIGVMVAIDLRRGGQGAAIEPRFAQVLANMIAKGAGHGSKGTRLQAISCEMLFDLCIDRGGEVSPPTLCDIAGPFLKKAYEAMIESDPDGGWEDRRNLRFGA